jgi:hypothetical protein
MLITNRNMILKNHENNENIVILEITVLCDFSYG